MPQRARTRDEQTPGKSNPRVAGLLLTRLSRTLDRRNFMAGRPAWQANQPFAAGWKQPAPQSTLAPAAAEQLLLRSKKKAPVPKQDLTPRGLASSSSASLKPTNFLQRNVSAASLAPRRSAAPGPPSPLTTHPHLTTHHSPFTVTVTAHRSPLTFHPHPHPNPNPSCCA